MSDSEISNRPKILIPKFTAAVVLGAHDWSDAGLARAPSFLRSAKGVVQYLIDSAGLSLDPSLVLDLVDDISPAAEQLARIRDTLNILLRERRDIGRPVADVLIYYVGHGHTDDQGHLSMLVRRSRKGLEAVTGIRASDLAQVLRVAAPQQRRMIILDCCFSEAAARGFIGQSGSLDQAVASTVAKDLRDENPQRGTLLLCSSPTSEISIGPPTAEYTLFTGAVLDVLRFGASSKTGALSFADLRDEAYDRMVISIGADAPRPALHQTDARHGDLTRMPAFPNRNRAAPATATNEAATHRPTHKGDIYLASVVRVEPALQAAFVDFGGAHHGFLPFSEVHPDYYQIPIADRRKVAWSTPDASGSEGSSPGGTPPIADEALEGLAAASISLERPQLQKTYKIQEVIKRRQVVLVQVIREESERRGAALTTYLTLAGRLLVMLANARPGSSGHNVPKPAIGRLRSAKRELGWPDSLGLVLRKTGFNQPKDALKLDGELLLKTWNEVRDRTLQSTPPSLVYELPPGAS
jgi:hypothetical protein